jgi:L-fucose mutarotase/ribose pyranase (RbsD/FucU family)
MNIKTEIQIILLLLVSLATGCKSSKWTNEFDQTLSEFGHRNWIVVADAAYPSQNSNGIKTIVTGQSQTQVLEYVLAQIEKSPHVKPIIMVDNELKYITDKDAPGIEGYKVSLDSLMSTDKVLQMQHEDIIEKLDQGSKLFNVLILKSTMTIPYTSVFINLDCDYWSADKEMRLRENMNNTSN